MMNLLLAIISGTIFGLGLSLSQMINPNKVLGFLDIMGDWDPSLILVMTGALIVAIPSFRWARRQGKPVFDNHFHMTTKTMLDKPLLIGATVFGVGWGMTGYCPGPAFASLALGSKEAVIMVASVYAGFWVAGLFNGKN